MTPSQSDRWAYDIPNILEIPVQSLDPSLPWQTLSPGLAPPPSPELQAWSAEHLCYGMKAFPPLPFRPAMQQAPTRETIVLPDAPQSPELDPMEVGALEYENASVDLSTGMSNLQLPDAYEYIADTEDHDAIMDDQDDEMASTAPHMAARACGRYVLTALPPSAPHSDADSTSNIPYPDQAAATFRNQMPDSGCACPRCSASSFNRAAYQEQTPSSPSGIPLWSTRSLDIFALPHGLISSSHPSIGHSPQNHSSSSCTNASHAPPVKPRADSNRETTTTKADPNNDRLLRRFSAEPKYDTSGRILDD